MAEQIQTTELVVDVDTEEFVDDGNPLSANKNNRAEGGIYIIGDNVVDANGTLIGKVNRKMPTVANTVQTAVTSPPMPNISSKSTTSPISNVKTHETVTSSGTSNTGDTGDTGNTDNQKEK